jgi:hypothetical protein
MTHSDPIQFVRSVLREAIAEGRGHDAGTTEIDGRTVRRFRLDCPPRAAHCPGPSYMYVDPETFLPVQLEQPSSFTFGWYGIGYQRFDVVWRYHAIEYLPRTEANLALTDIRAQHTGAVER